MYIKLRRSLLLALGLSFFFSPGASLAAGVPYSQLSSSDKRDFILHFSVGYAANLTGSMLLKKAGLKPFYAVLFSSLLMSAAAYAKEKYHDSSYSGSDMSGGMAGIGTAALTFMILEF